MARITSASRRFARLAGLLLLLAAGGGGPKLAARDAFVLLSGGDTPLDNHYSQFLQARAMAGFFLKNYPPDSVWIFFAAGNVEGEKPFIGDVHRELKQDGVLVDAWLPGTLPHNHPARRDVILRTLREEILPAVADGGTLYLFVGDHGSRTRGRNAESIITLWSLAPDPAEDHGWRVDENETLGVRELRNALARGIGKGRVVFCMTQCHGGGFHYLAMPREMTPDPKWFTVLPDWAAPRDQPDFPPAAGFTATDELSPAAGCDPDPDPDNWAGYERFLPENLLGVDLFSLKPAGRGLRSFAEAHVAATLVDQTIDKPCSTSERYLERWAELIERRLANEPGLTGTVRRQVDAYFQAVTGGTFKASDAAFRERQAEFRRFTERLATQNPALKQLLLAGSRKQLETAMGLRNEMVQMPPRRPPPPAAPDPAQPPPPAAGRGRGRGGARGVRQLWTATVRPAWKAAVEAGEAAGLTAGAVAFEKHLLAQEERGRNYFFGDADSLQQEVYWESGYGTPQSLNPAKARAVALWGVERRDKILAWARASAEPAVRTAAARLAQSPQFARPTEPADFAQAGPAPVSKDIAAERVLFYRRVLAAWQFLLALDERPALDRVKDLTALERTPLPAPRPAR